MGKHIISDLYQMQSMPLDIKVRMTENRIRGWVNEFGQEGTYISFSGGKDSTVLVDIVTNLGYTDIPLVFIDTGLEYPEIREFVKTYGDRITWIKPKKNFRQVINDYGYPFISKEVSECVYGAKKYLEALAHSSERESNLPYSYFYRKLMGLGEYSKTISRKRNGKRRKHSEVGSNVRHTDKERSDNGEYP